MKFIRDLISKKHQDADRGASHHDDPLEKSYRDTIGSLADTTATQQRPGGRFGDLDHDDVNQDQPAKPVVNIWDLEQDETAPALSAAVADMSDTPAPVARAQARPRRPKTRLIGFEKSNGDIIDLFSDTPHVTASQRVRFPVGWVVIAEGPGVGESFALLTGMSQIGRGEDQAIQLDFGDTAISRNNHAAIVYDPENHTFWLGHGGKTNIVRLNGKPVIANELLTSGDLIRIGETILRFVALCDSNFNWAGQTDAQEDDDDVAIA